MLRRDDEGRYQVSLPWLRVHPELSDNRDIAEKRLKSCVRTLQKRNCLQEYGNIFKEWVSEEIIEPVEPEELAREKGQFLPHQPIFKENSTTRIYLVFDASAKERISGSLNDCIEKGPNYLELIPKLLNRFRQGKYGVISDIRQAFLQIKVAPSDRKFLRFLWWEEGDPRKRIVYSHCRVVFGVNASPFLLAATINYHLENVAESQRGIAAKLKESMYVDNCGVSVNTLGLTQVRHADDFYMLELSIAWNAGVFRWNMEMPLNSILGFDRYSKITELLLEGTLQVNMKHGEDKCSTMFYKTDGSRRNTTSVVFRQQSATRNTRENIERRAFTEKTS
ncbi:integrase catalytic domain-containing protein [Trichonephila clavipes]|nr:integrase catalytic domain-containing protein [Trichonephila clavipes]